MADNRLPYFISGVGIGAAIGLLLTPARGEEARAGLLQAAEDGREFVAEASGNLRSFASDALETGKQLAEDRKGVLQGAFEAGMQAYYSASKHSE